MKRTFMEFPAFSRLVKAGKISDNQVRLLQLDIMAGGGSAIEGTGGIKKIRCGTKGGGKSGGWRVLFADYVDCRLTFLIWAFPKGGQDSLTGAQKKIIRQIKRDIDREVKR